MPAVRHVLSHVHCFLPSSVSLSVSLLLSPPVVCPAALQNFLQRLSTKASKRVFLLRKRLCKTAAGNSCDVITITSPPPKSKKVKKITKRAVLITARVHPGETNASWMMHVSRRRCCHCLPGCSPPPYLCPIAAAVGTGAAAVPCEQCTRSKAVAQTLCV